MKRIHLCCGDIYLNEYENCDINGKLTSDCTQEEVEINKTTLDKYFKYPFEPDASKRIRRDFILDTQMNILERWPWEDNTIDEVVMVNGFEHFTHNKDIPHIIAELLRGLKVGGVFKFDFPDMKKIVELYHDNEDDPDYCACLLYCNHKNEYSIHHWGYTKESIKNYLIPEKWDLEFKDVVKHDYPSQGCWAIKK